MVPTFVPSLRHSVISTSNFVPRPAVYLGTPSLVEEVEEGPADSETMSDGKRL